MANRRRRYVYLLLFLLLGVNYFTRTTLSVAAQPVAQEFHLSPIAMGYLFSSFLWTYLISLIPVGLLVDRAGPRIVAAAGIALWSAATIGTALSTSYAALMATRLVMGIGEATSYPASIRAVRDWAPASERGVATSILNGGAFAGPAAGALLTGLLVAGYGWRWSFVVAAAIGFLWIVPWLIWFRAPEKATFITDEERQLIIGGRRAEGASTAPKTPLFVLLRSRSLLSMAFVQGCAVYAQYLFLTWLPSYLQITKGLNISRVGVYTAVPYVISIFLAVLMCHVSDLLLTDANLPSGKRRYMVAATLVFSSLILLTPMVNSIWAITALVTLSLSGVSAAVALNFTLATDLLKSSHDTGTVTSILVIGGNIFGMLAPIVTGYVIAGTGSYNWAFLIAGLLLVGGAATALFLTKPD